MPTYYTQGGTIIRNHEAYAKTGAPMYKTENTRSTDINKPHDIYKINCTNGKKYIGKTTDIERRIGQHATGNGAKVTKKFKPKTFEVVDSCPGFFSDKLEQYHTEENITDHGYENVRGGTYTNSKTLHKTRNGNRQLSKSEDRERIKLRKKKSLTREEHNRLEELKCCNRRANGKDYTIKKYNEVREDDLELIWTDELMTAGMSGDEEMFCATCGRNGHNYQSCYAKIDFEGNRITH
jgi:predicted GIY-YIG superfamily endonuclease